MSEAASEMTGATPEMGAGGYDPGHFAPLLAAEDRHFWFRARNHVISTLVRQIVAPLSPGYRVLEMGCGDGNVLRFLERACPTGSVTGMDLFHEGLRIARDRCSCPLVQGDVATSPFGKPFDLIGVFDVLEHLPEDRRILTDLSAQLKPGGALLLTVPAHRSLWSRFDRLSGHCRRYEPAELREKLETAGFEVEFQSPYMASLRPLMWLSRRSQRDAAVAPEDASRLLEQELRIVPVLNGLLAGLLALETRRLAARRPRPVGASLHALARKPQSVSL